MSAKVVTPARICSAAASRVPQRTNSSVTFFASAGKMYFRNHSSSVTSSCSPRKRVIGTCVCPLMNPGSTNFPLALMVCGAAYLLSISARGPSARIASPFTAMAPYSRMRRFPSIVTTVPPLTSRSTFSFFAVCAWRPAENTKLKMETRATACRERDLRIQFRFSIFTFPSSYRLEESNGFGNNSRIGMTSVLPFKFARITGTSPQNSQISWRHAPQGGVSVSVSVTTAIASKPRSPSLIALKMAMRSAQTVRPYVAFSTLQPPKILPEVARSAAPTRKFEYGACAFSLACLAAEIRISCSFTLMPPGTPQNILRNRLRNSRDDRFQQADELPFHALCCLQHFQVVERLIQNSRRRICHAGDAEHANAAMPRGDHFRNRGHTHQIGADRAQIAYLRRRLIARPEESRVHALKHPDAHAVSFADGHLTKSAVVRRGHVVETQAESLVVRSGQRIDALQIDVIADHHQPALHEFPFDAARGVGEDHGLYAHARENADGKRHLFRGVAFVKMDPALHPGHGNRSHFSDDELARMANGGRLRKVRNFRVGDFGGIGEFVRESAKT